MEAGRELDALVAEKVMGWKRELTPSGCLWFSFSGHPLANAIKGPDCPPYSIDIAAAWEMIPHLPQLQLWYNGPNAAEKWHCVVYPKDGRSKGAVADTAPLAICLAALKAVGAM